MQIAQQGSNIMASLFRGKDTAHSPQDSRDVESGKQREATRLLPETLWADEPMPDGIPPEDRVVVTISRQFGSGGSDIAQQVAAQAGLHYVDHHLITESARRLGVDVEHVAQHDEQTAGMVGHILGAIQASNPLNANYLSLLAPASLLAQANELAYLQLTQRIILEMATEGNVVIVGRGSQFLLHHAPRTLHISIFAPLPYRIGNIMQRFQINRATATRLIEQRDYEQASYLRRYYGNDGQQAGLYHLLINTSLIAPTLAANLICQAVPVIKDIM